MAEPKKPRDVGASVRARLLTLARQKGYPSLYLALWNNRLIHMLLNVGTRQHELIKV